ncbi:hypothetical protein L1987_05720 [Smallanthus sonchifolius]|uniref:Uncharacterized protein n=1 Tax=Smallanthus sonchifolius TaxID=185202 RepID=A0ACB9JWJ1_9ASTR|nr:hypothetical protein L1987_05720 [Smallanthus sonchifolius]
MVFGWSAIAAKLPGRSDNEIKNRWNTHLKKRAKDNQTVLETDHNETTKQPADQAIQKENPEQQLQNKGEMSLAGESLDSPSCYTRTELSSCWFNGLGCGVSSNVGSQMVEDFWTEPFLADITSSVDYNISSPLNVVDDLITQSSCKEMTINDDVSWSMLDSYDEYNYEFSNCWDQ